MSNRLLPDIKPSTRGVRRLDKDAPSMGDSVCDSCGKRPSRVWWFYDDHTACCRMCLQLLVFEDLSEPLSELDKK